MSQTHNCRKCHRHRRRRRRRRHHKCHNQRHRHRHRHRRRPRRHRHRTKTNSIMNKLNHENSIMKTLNHCLTEQQLHSQMSLPRIETTEIIKNAPKHQLTEDRAADPAADRTRGLLWSHVLLQEATLRSASSLVQSSSQWPTLESLQS